MTRSGLQCWTCLYTSRWLLCKGRGRVSVGLAAARSSRSCLLQDKIWNGGCGSRIPVFNVHVSSKRSLSYVLSRSWYAFRRLAVVAGANQLNWCVLTSHRKCILGRYLVGYFTASHSARNSRRKRIGPDSFTFEDSSLQLPSASRKISSSFCSSSPRGPALCVITSTRC